MRSHTQKSFWDAFHRSPVQVQEQARGAYRFFSLNPGHPSLRFKRVGHGQPVYSVRIGDGYRALGVRQENTIVWFWIGSHDEYERMIKRK